MKLLIYILYMGCDSCKDKKKLKDELYDSTKFVEKSAIYFVIVWSLFAIYGIYSFIKLFL